MEKPHLYGRCYPFFVCVCICKIKVFFFTVLCMNPFFYCFLINRSKKIFSNKLGVGAISIKLYFRNVFCRVILLSGWVFKMEHQPAFVFSMHRWQSPGLPLRIVVSHSRTSTKCVYPMVYKFAPTRKHLLAIVCQETESNTSFWWNQLKNGSLVFFPLFLEPCLTLVVKKVLG